MKKLAEFEGIAGFRWGALRDTRGVVHFSEDAPQVADRKIALIEQVLGHAPFQLEHADLIFGKGRVLLRRGSFGMLILFCEDMVNASMVDIVIEEEWLSKAEPEVRRTMDRSSPGQSSITLSPIQSIGIKDELVPGEVVEEVLEVFTRFLGPLARVLAQKACREADLDLEHLSARDWVSLLNTLAARISDETKRNAFLDQAVLLKNKF